MTAARGVSRPPAHGADDLAQFNARLAQLRATAQPPEQPGTFTASTDGACVRNPDGPGGWAAVVSADGAGRTWELWGHLTSTSNNRAEALGILAALTWVPAGSSLTVRADSEYAVRVLTGAYRARANTDVWEEIRRVLSERRLDLRAEWVRGHAGDAGNERADELAVLGSVAGDEARARALRSQRAASARPAAAPPATARSLPPELADLEPRGPWESSFVQSVARQVRAGRPLSEKQRAVLDRIRARQGGQAATGGVSAA